MNPFSRRKNKNIPKKKPKRANDYKQDDNKEEKYEPFQPTLTMDTILNLERKLKSISNNVTFDKDDYNRSLREKNKEIQFLTNNVNKLTNNINTLQNQLNNANNQINKQTNYIKSIQNQLKIRNDEILSNIQIIQNKDTEITKQYQQIYEKDDKINQLKDDIQEKDGKINQLNHIIQERDDKIQEKDETINEFKRSSLGMIDIATKYETLLTKYNNLVYTHNTSLEEAKEKQNELIRDYNDLAQRKNSEMEKKREEYNKLINEYNEMSEAKREKYNKLIGEYNELNQKFDKYKQNAWDEFKTIPSNLIEVLKILNTDKYYFVYASSTGWCGRKYTGGKSYDIVDGNFKLEIFVLPHGDTASGYWSDCNRAVRYIDNYDKWDAPKQIFNDMEDEGHNIHVFVLPESGGWARCTWSEKDYQYKHTSDKHNVIIFK